MPEVKYYIEKLNEKITRCLYAVVWIDRGRPRKPRLLGGVKGRN